MDQRLKICIYIDRIKELALSIIEDFNNPLSIMDARKSIRKYRI